MLVHLDDDRGRVLLFSRLALLGSLGLLAGLRLSVSLLDEN